jgi:hypothetical protein
MKKEEESRRRRREGWNNRRKNISVRFEVFTAVTMKNVIFCDIKTVRTSQETHYVSATESSRLMLCKI